MMRLISAFMSGAGFLALSGCVQVYAPPQPAPATTAVATTSTKDSASAEKEKSDPFKPWKEAVKDTRTIDGFLTFRLKRDNTLFLELRPAQLGMEFGMVMHYSRGIGDFNVHDGLYLDDTHLLRLDRHGDQVYLVRVNPRFTAAPGSPMRASLQDNVGHSILAAFKIESEHDTTKAVLIDVTTFFVSDYPDVARWIKLYYGNKSVSFDKARSFVEGIRGFPKNVEIDAAMTFQSGDLPVIGGEGVSDYRSIPLGIRYSLFALPDVPMQRRLADDRIGFFLDAQRDFSRDREETTFVRYVTRWRLEKKDPTQELSEPVQPIVYYVDRSVPLEYRRYVREGIEAWNKAFEAAGFKNAIVARDAPDDSTWSAEDVRYSTVRWTAAHRMGYAIGPSQTDPRTGEILNADILVSWSFVQGWLYEWQELAGPDALIRRFREAIRLQGALPPSIAQRICYAQFGMQHQLGMQHAMLVGLGVLDGGQPLPEKYLGDAIRDLIMHEVGHTLGLRHNFKGSSGIPRARLNDTTFTREHGVTLSVMDYGPVNVAVDPAKQGFYWNQGVGTYDVWTMQYGYTPIHSSAASSSGWSAGQSVTRPQDELPMLQSIAQRASEPLHTFGTDEDNWLGPWALDPHTSAWDLGSSPVGYASDRIAVIERVLPRLEHRLIGEGEGYQRLRGATTGLLFEQFIAMLPVTKVVGGMEVSRAHKGDPGAKPPFRPLPAAEQRAAVQLLADEVFAEGAFDIEPSYLNKLAPNRWAHWGVPWFAVPVDYPIHSYVAFVQLALLNELLSPPRLTRMIDNEARVPVGTEPYRVSELLGTLTSVTWSELGTSPERARSIDSFRRNLQRGFIDEFTLLLRADNVGVPEDARAIVRFELTRLAERIEGVLASAPPLDTTTRAHLAESKARIDQALSISLTIPLR